MSKVFAILGRDHVNSPVQISRLLRYETACYCGVSRSGKFYRNARLSSRCLTPSLRGMTAAKASQNAYIEPDFQLDGASAGPLSGLTFAVKGCVVGFGNPKWKATHSPATSTAPAIQALLDAGAHLRGRTHMDELAYSLNGENKHYGTPVNPACPDRVPGGSSSGAAVVVAAGDVDFSVGSDTGGSVRVPASYCGIFGMRPSHGRMSLEGVRPLAPSLDTGGWFARNPVLLKRIGSVLLQGPPAPVRFQRCLLATDAWSLCLGDTGRTLLDRVMKVKHRLDEEFGPLIELPVADPGKGLGSLQDWFQVFRVIQAAEAWKALGDWITDAQPDFGPGVRERFEAAARIKQEEVAEKLARREEIIQHLDSILHDDAFLVVPSAPGPAPKLNTPASELEGFRSRLLALTCIAGVAKLPQISIPCGAVAGCPVAVGIIGPRGSDEALLEAAEKLHGILKA